MVFVDEQKVVIFSAAGTLLVPFDWQMWEMILAFIGTVGVEK